MKLKIVLSCVLAGMFVQAATWTGGGDGVTWGDSANWGGLLPGATEEVTITTPANALEIKLGATDREIGKLIVAGTGKLTLTGTAALLLQNLENSVDVDIDVPVTLKNGNNSIKNNVKILNFMKPVTAVGTKSVTLSSSNTSNAMSTNFRDTFTGPGSTINLALGMSWEDSAPRTAAHFYGKVIAAKMACSSTTVSGWAYLHASGNEIGKIEVCYGGVSLVGENALPATTPLEWATFYLAGRNEGLYSFNFTGTDQVAEAVRCAQIFEPSKNTTRFLRSLNGTKTTLTLKDASDATANCAVNAGMSLVWDPLGDFTQEFIEQPSRTEGTVTVKRGTFKVGAGASFSNLTSIAVADGAVFDLATDVAGSLSYLMTVTVGTGGKLKVAATSVNPFAQQAASAHLKTGAVIETATPLVFQQLTYNGEKVAAGTYGAGATAADWVTGGSTVQVFGGEEESKTLRTWTAAGDGVTWTDDANWDTRAPFSRDSVYFPTDATITSDVVITGGARSIDVADGKKVTISGNISGDTDILKVGQGELALSGSNSFTGSLFINAGRVTAIGDCALGDNANGAIDLTKKNDPLVHNLILSGVTVRKELIVRNMDDAQNNYRQALQCAANTENVLLGKLTVPNSYLRMQAASNAKFIIRGGATFNTSTFFDRAAGTEVIIRDIPIVHSIYQDNHANGKLIFDCVGNSIRQWNGDYTRGAHERIETRVDGALNEQTWFYMGLYEGNAGISILDLCGTTQRVSCIEAVVYKGSLAKSGTITSADPATIAYTAAKTYTNSCIYAGAVTLEQAGTGALYLTAPSTSTGDLVASAGTVVLAEGASWAGSYVLRGGTVRLPGPIALDSSARLTLAGGTLELPAGEYLVAGITDADGNLLPPGRYAATAGDGVQVLAGLSGDGVVTILPSGGTPAVYTWVGANGGRFTSEANWEGGVLPDFSNAMGEYHFPDNGFTATVDTNVVAKSFVFSSQLADTIRLVAADDDAGITFSDGALVVTGAVGAAKSVVFDVPVKYAVGLAVRAGDPAVKSTSSHQLVFTNRLSTVGAADLRKDGYGTLTFAGDQNDMVGDIVVSNGFVHLMGADPLGGSGTFKLYAPKGCYDTKLKLFGATVTRPLWFTHPSDENGELLMTGAGTTNYVTALVTCANGHFRNRAANRSGLHYQGGLYISNFFIPYAPDDGSGYIIVEGLPISYGNQYWSDHSSPMVSCVFASEGNTFRGEWVVHNTIELRVDNAIASNQKVAFKYNTNVGKTTAGLLNLTNTRQEFATCMRGTFSTNSQGLVTWASQAKVTGTSGSQLKLNGSDRVLNLPVFTDAANYVQAGTAERWFRDPCTSTGELYVASGTLVLAAPDEAYDGRAVAAESAPLFKGGAWAGPKVRISGGTLKANHAKAFTRTADVEFIDVAGKLEIPAGVSIPCGYIYVDGVRQDLGTYTAKNFGDHISGGGSLVSQGLGLGTVLLFR